MDEEVGVEITSEKQGVIVIFKSASISDVDEINFASRQIKDFIDDKQPEMLIFDFSRVKFFSSQVLGLLLDIRSQMELHNGEVVVSAINPQLHRVFKITNLDKIFRFFPDKESAVQSMSSN
jgi:anti-sigma B factor antagonist